MTEKLLQEGRVNVAVLFGGDSVEHEVSIISAVQAMTNMDTEKYNIIPVYIAKDGRFYTANSMKSMETFRGENALENLTKKAAAVTFCRQNGKTFLQSAKRNDYTGRKPIPVDVAFPIVHGTNCEDGTLQGLLEMFKLPYVGCDVTASAVGMNKVLFKNTLKAYGIPVLDCIKFSDREFVEYEHNILNRIEKSVTYPAIVKPVNLGSSIGISKVENSDGLQAAIQNAFQFSKEVMVERAVCNLREINCAVLGDSFECKASACEEPIMHDEILSYGDKYLSNGQKGGGKSDGMQSLSRKLPADLPADLTESIKEFACRAFKAIGANGVARIDFLMDNKSKEVFVNEINTIPGSLAFYLWEASGLKYPELLDEMIQLAFKRQRERDSLAFEINTNILAQTAFGTKGAKGSKF